MLKRAIQRNFYQVFSILPYFTIVTRSSNIIPIGEELFYVISKLINSICSLAFYLFEYNKKYFSGLNSIQGIVSKLPLCIDANQIFYSKGFFVQPYLNRTSLLETFKLNENERKDHLFRRIRDKHSCNVLIEDPQSQ